LHHAATAASKQSAWGKDQDGERFRKMIEGDKAVALDFRDAFALARELVADIP